MIKYTSNGDVLYLESHFHTFFKSSPLAVLEAEFSFNRGLATGTCLGNFSYLYQFLDLEPPEEANEVGWNYEYLVRDWCSTWVDFVHTPRITDDGKPYIEISYPMEPKPMDFLEGMYD